MIEEGEESSFSVISAECGKESVCSERVSMACSCGALAAGGELFMFRLACLRRRQKRASRRRMHTNARAPMAMPILAARESPPALLDRTGAAAVAVAVDPMVLDRAVVVG